MPLPTWSGAVCALILGTGACSAASERDSARAELEIGAESSFSVRRELRIDGDRHLFSYPSEFLLVDLDGSLVFSDRISYQLRFFRADGTHVLDFGGKGEGPGEFLAAARISSLTGGFVGDSIWVYDPMRRRLTYLSRRGNYLGSALAPRVVRNLDGTLATLRAGVVQRIEPFAVYPDASLLALIANIEDSDIIAREFWILNSEGQRSLFLAKARTPDVVRVRNDQSASYFIDRVPFSPETAYDVAQDGSRLLLVTPLMNGPSAQLDVLVLSPEGVTLVRRIFSVNAPAIPPARMDSTVDAYRQRLERVNATTQPPRYAPSVIADAVRRMRSQLPQYQSPVQVARAGTDGTSWIALNGSDSRSIQWLIVGAKGDSVGAVTLPSWGGFYFATGSMTHIWGFERDGTTEVPSLVRYGLVRSQ